MVLTFPVLETSPSGQVTYPPDRQAQRLRQALKVTSERLADLVLDIPNQTVRGPETRSELTSALGLLNEAAELLDRTRERELDRFLKLCAGRDF